MDNQKQRAIKLLQLHDKTMGDITHYLEIHNFAREIPRDNLRQFLVDQALDALESEPIGDRQKAIKLLEEIQWMNSGTCPICGVFTTHGHDKYCEIYQALAALELESERVGDRCSLCRGTGIMSKSYDVSDLYEEESESPKKRIVLCEGRREFGGDGGRGFDCEPKSEEKARKHGLCLACGGYISKDEMIYLGKIHVSCHWRKMSEPAKPSEFTKRARD